MSEPRTAPRPVMTRALTLLLAVTGGVAVGNLYWAQPLLEVIGRDLHVSNDVAGWLVTATQLGYALGILLIVPLGDMLNRRLLIRENTVTAADACPARAPHVAAAATSATTVRRRISRPGRGPGRSGARGARRR